MTLSRRHAVAGAALAAGVRPARAQPRRFVWKCASDVPTTHPIDLRLVEAAARIKTETGGEMELQLFPNNQLGSDTDMLSQVRGGGIELMTMPGVVLATLVPAPR